MSQASNYLENKLTDHVFRGQAFTPPVTLYFSLHTADPTDLGTGTEVSGGSYARAAVTASLANWSGTQASGSTTASSGTSGASSNNNVITFPTPTANWGLITHYGIWDAVSGGNLLCFGAVTPNKTINNGDAAPTIPAAGVSVAIA